MKDAIILANGEFPSGELALRKLNESRHIVCCDGAADNLIAHGYTPWAIVGDCDSLNENTLDRFTSIVHRDPDQETNDLTKAVEFVIRSGFKSATILGATGLREDHTIANVSLLLEYAPRISVCMITSYGIFTPIIKDTTFESHPKEQVSIFALNPTQTILYKGLRYNLPENRARSWWSGSLNESLGDEFTIKTQGEAIIFQAF